MRPFNRLNGSSTTTLLTCILFALQISAQGLPKLSSSVADQTSSASASASATPTSSEASATTADSSNSLTSSVAAASSSILPGLSSSAYDGISNAPTLSGAYNYPPPSVPPTAAAPYMQKSSLPEGTVFICVGAVLGFFAMVVIAWRGLVVCALHRSTRRSSPLAKRYGGEYGGDAHASMLKNAAIPFYSHRPGSTLSLEQLGANRKSGMKGHTPTESLFFSPTAGAGTHAQSNRVSGYLPAGYYAAGNTAPGGGAGAIHLGGGRPISLANLGSQSHGYQRATSIDPSPPVSPSLPPSRETEIPYGRSSAAGLSTMPSSSTVNLPPQGRVPSAYLDDLFDKHPPDQFSNSRSAEGRKY